MAARARCPPSCLPARCLHPRAQAARTLPAPTRPPCPQHCCQHPRAQAACTHVPGLPAALPAPLHPGCLHAAGTVGFWCDLYPFRHIHQTPGPSPGIIFNQGGVVLGAAAGEVTGGKDAGCNPPGQAPILAPPHRVYFIFGREFLPALQNRGLFLFPEWKPSLPSPALKCQEWAFGHSQTPPHADAEQINTARCGLPGVGCEHHRGASRPASW